MNRPFPWSIGLLIFMVFPSLGYSENQKTLYLSSSEDQLSYICITLLKEAYAPLGYQIEPMVLPPFRASPYTNQGLNDGMEARIAEFEKFFPNLVMIPVPIVPLELVAFTKDLSIPIEGWQSLAPHRVALQRGYKIMEINTRGMERHLVSRLDQVFYLLNLDRVQIALSSHVMGLEYLANQQLKTIKPLLPPIVTVNLYHYLHKKHQALVEPVTAQMKQLEASGRIAEVRRQVMQTIQQSLYEEPL